MDTDVRRKHGDNMKIEIDLNDILGGDEEYGSETLNESIRRQVVDKLTKTVSEGIGKRIDVELARVIDEQITTGLKDKLPALVDDILAAEYTPVDRYGHRSKETTNIRAEIVKTVTEQMVYKTGGYSSEKNAYTSAVDGLISKHVGEFKAAFDKQIDATFVREAMEYATKKLGERLGVKKHDA